MIVKTLNTDDMSMGEVCAWVGSKECPQSARLIKMRVTDPFLNGKGAVLINDPDNGELECVALKFNDDADTSAMKVVDVDLVAKVIRNTPPKDVLVMYAPNDIVMRVNHSLAEYIALAEEFCKGLDKPMREIYQFVEGLVEVINEFDLNWKELAEFLNNTEDDTTVFDAVYGTWTSECTRRLEEIKSMELE